MFCTVGFDDEGWLADGIGSVDCIDFKSEGGIDGSGVAGVECSAVTDEPGYSKISRSRLIM